MRRLTLLALLTLLVGCNNIPLPDLPDDPLDPLPEFPAYPDAGEPMRSLLFTPIGVVNELTEWYIRTGELMRLRTRYNTLGLFVDLPCPVGQMRTYIGPGRSETEPTELLLDNLHLLTRSFRVNVLVYNEPSVRLNLSGNMGTFNFTHGVRPENMYTEERLAKEKLWWSNFKRMTEERGIPIYAATLVVEPSHVSAKSFQFHLAHFIRNDLGWSSIRLFGNGMGQAFWCDPRVLRVEGFPSHHDVNTWCTTPYIPNGDGQFWMNQANAQHHMANMSSCRQEWQFWIPELAGYGYSPDQRPVVQDWHYEYIERP